MFDFLLINKIISQLEMGPDPTRACF